LSSTADYEIVRPCAGVHGPVRVPGDKSISHRVAMLSALASGVSTIKGFLLSEDCLDTLGALEFLGASVSRDGDVVRIRGTDGMFMAPSHPLDMGNSGTGMRLLAGLLAGQEFTSEMRGDASLSARPMMRIKEPLELMGAEVELRGPDGCAPVRITGGRLKGIKYALPVASAQVKSCVLLAGLFADGTTQVVEPKATRDHTERMLRAMGIDLESRDLTASVGGSGGKSLHLKHRDWDVPGDFSSAACWITASACMEGSEIVVERVGLNPRRTALAEVLRRMGAEIEVGPRTPDDGHRAPEERGRQAENSGADTAPEWEPVGSVTVRGRGLRGTIVGGDEIPNLIDELPLIAVAGARAEGVTVIRDASELRVKESDRIASVAEGLASVGVAVEEKPDGMVIRGGTNIRGGVQIDSCLDHRVAMAMAVLGLSAAEPVRILNASCVSTSYPSFWDDFRRMTGDN